MAKSRLTRERWIKKAIIHFAATTTLTPRENEWYCKGRVREIWANPYRVYGLGTTRIREEKPGNWKFARVKCPRKQRDSWLGVSLVGFYPNNNQILEFYCAYWSLFEYQASLGHATLGDEIWETICNLEFGKAGSYCRKPLPSVRQIEPAVWLISNCFSSEYFFLEILKLEKRIFSRLATRAAGSMALLFQSPPPPNPLAKKSLF